AFGVEAEEPLSASEFWRAIIEDDAVSARIEHEEAELLDLILTEGTLAFRMTQAVGPNPGQKTLAKVHEQLCEMLAEGTPFMPGR
ncbi:MAG: hypothetical protein OEZ55_10865, partial [Nitrospinota bacterium]|nr:hypothetical protein [Nitrospinota bacterium]